LGRHPGEKEETGGEFGETHRCASRDVPVRKGRQRAVRKRRQGVRLGRHPGEKEETKMPASLAKSMISML
jgi:hypothetical protein